jgi:hypothetical protein
MSEQKRIKQVHQTMRAAGYVRRNWKTRNDNFTYEAYYHKYSREMTIFVPGSWSITMRNMFTNELKKVLADFRPRKEEGYAGVRITVTEIVKAAQ